LGGNTNPPAGAPRAVRFGVFELELRTGELRRKGVKVALREQPFEVLAMLVAHPGELVTREALRRALWPKSVFVDFDPSTRLSRPGRHETGPAQIRYT